MTCRNFPKKRNTNTLTKYITLGVNPLWITLFFFRLIQYLRQNENTLIFMNFTAYHSMFKFLALCEIQWVVEF